MSALLDPQEIVLFIIIAISYIFVIKMYIDRKKAPLLLLAFTALLISQFCSNLEVVFMPVEVNIIEHASLMLSGILFAVVAYKNHEQIEWALASAKRAVRE